MKRDARIGLAIVLVLGLSVTFLVARTFHDRTEELAALDNYEQQVDSDIGPLASADGTAPLADTRQAPPPPALAPHDKALSDFMADHQNPPAPLFENDRFPVSVPTDERRAETVELPEEPATPARTDGTLMADIQLPPLIRADPPATTRSAPSASNGNKSNRIYKIVSGDNPWRIAQKVYGDGRLASKIIAANKDINAHRLPINQEIIIPELEGITLKVNLPTAHGLVTASPAPTTPTTPTPSAVTASTTRPNPAGASAGNDTTNTYVIKQGDTLAQIANQIYGYAGPMSIKRIMDANPGLDPMRLKVGINVIVPPKEN